MKSFTSIITRTSITMVALLAAVFVTGSLTASANTNGRSAKQDFSGMIAYTRGVDTNGDGIFMGGTNEELGTDIYMQPIGGGEPIMVNAPNSRADITPSFSPDGTKIAWASNATPSGNFDIFVKDLTTGVIKNITNTAGKTFERWPNWSSDGKKIVYNRRDGRNNLDIWMMNADGSNRRYVAGKKGPGKFFEDCCVSFSPDDSSVVFASNRTGDFNVYSYKISSARYEVATNLKKLTSHKFYEGTPSVEPSGSIVYRMGGNIQQIYRLSPNGARYSTSVVRVSGGIRTPSSSPDGSALTFGWYQNPGDQLEIAITDSMGGSFTNVTNTPEYSETDPTWTF